MRRLWAEFRAEMNTPLAILWAAIIFLLAMGTVAVIAGVLT